jgi:5'-methylthioinosine phosphorylase
VVKEEKKYAIIAGSGLQELAADSAGQEVTTVFGDPSSPIRELLYGDRSVLFLGRHGDDFLIPPHRINYRANVKALQQLGVDCIIGMNTVGVITGEAHPGEIALPDQLTDYTHDREHSIYDGTNAIVNVEFTEPFSATLRKALLAAAAIAKVAVHDGGVYAVTQGPRLETAAEVDRLERDGADFVGMTLMPEASLAMELGMEYASLSLIVNYAAGRSENAIHAEVDASTMAAKSKAVTVLAALFDADA